LGTGGGRAGEARGCDGAAGAVKKLRRSDCPLGGAPAMAPALEHGQSKKLAGFGSYRRGFFFGFGFFLANSKHSQLPMQAVQGQH